MKPLVFGALALGALVVSCDPKGGASGAAPTASSAPQPVGPPPGAATVDPEALRWVSAQHVLIAYKGAEGASKKITRSKEQARKLAEEVADKAKNGEDFGELARKYSDDPRSADRLGSVGRFERDAMVKQFSDAAFALKVGEVSGVVESPFGFHVIKRNQ